MRRVLFIVISFMCLFALGMQDASAQQVKEAQAKEKAMAFFRGTNQNKSSMRKAPRKVPKLSLANNRDEFFIYNDETNGGYVIISGDERAETVLGYSYEGTYDEAHIPDNFRWWMEGMAAEITALRQDTDAESSTPMRKVKKHSAISPLIKTKWGQGSDIYNALCPTIDGKHCSTGCVATAGAQIMYYHQWPRTATKTVPGYTGRITVDTSKDLDPIIFKWNDMKTNYYDSDKGTTSATAVAELMLYCGYAAKMEYGLGGSGASDETLAKGMADYFDYDPHTWKSVSRKNFRVSEWDSLIYNELVNNRPVVYDGGNKYMAHEFICDGYDGEGFYHFNWGWGGSRDGYYKLQAANPYLDLYPKYTEDIYNQGAIIGLQPNLGIVPTDPNADDEWENENIEGIVLTISEMMVSGSTISLVYENRNEETYTFDFGLGELNSDGTITVVYKCGETEFYNGTGNYRDLHLSDCDLSEGTHKLVPISLLKGETEWKRCKPATVWFEVTVSGDGSKTVIAHPIEKLTISDFHVTFGLQPDTTSYCPHRVALKVKNEGDNFDGTLYMYLGTEDEVGEYVYSKSIKILGGNTKHYDWLFYTKKSAGTYTLRIYDEYRGGNLLATTFMTLKQDLKATNFDIPGQHIIIPVIREVNVTVESYHGDYIAPLYLFASKTDEKGSAVYLAGTAIEENDKEVVTFYFKPNEAGIWNLWVCTDSEGKNVIGQTTVEFTDPPTEETKLEARNVKLTVGTTTILTMTITNTGGVTYFRDLRYSLAKEDEGENTFSGSMKSTRAIEILPGDSIIQTFTFEGLGEGKRYKIECFYYTNYSENNVNELARTGIFTVPSSSGIKEVLDETDEAPWFTLDGIRLNGRPQKSGVYIHHGKKVIIH